MTLKRTFPATPGGTCDGDADSTNAHDNKGMDPAQEEMFDRFFDLHKMEVFANEEEEMLPVDAFGKEDNPGNKDNGGWAGGDREKKKKGKKRMLPHLRNRLRDDSESDDDNNDDDKGGEEKEEDPLAKRFQLMTVCRKKYHPDNEVEALCECHISIQ